MAGWVWGLPPLAGCSPSAAGTSDAPVEESDWLGEAPEVSADDCSETVETDVLVVGAACAGSMAAYSAIRNGAKTVVIERNSTSHVGGQEASFINSKFQLESGCPEYNKIQIANKVFKEMQGRADMGHIATWVERSGDIFEDLREHFLDPYKQFYVANNLEGMYPIPRSRSRNMPVRAYPSAATATSSPCFWRISIGGSRTTVAAFSTEGVLRSLSPTITARSSG